MLWKTRQRKDPLTASHGCAPSSPSEQRGGAVGRLPIANGHNGITELIAKSLVASIDRPPVAHDSNLDGAGLPPHVRPAILAHCGCAVFDIQEFHRVVNTEVLEGVESQVGRDRSSGWWRKSSTRLMKIRPLPVSGPRTMGGARVHIPVRSDLSLVSSANRGEVRSLMQCAPWGPVGRV
jgi:hypothetical protein